MSVAGTEHLLTGGDFLSIPPGTPHSLVSEAHLTRYSSMFGPAGPERLFELAGEVAAQRIFPEQAPSSTATAWPKSPRRPTLDITFAG